MASLICAQNAMVTALQITLRSVKNATALDLRPELLKFLRKKRSAEVVKAKDIKRRVMLAEIALELVLYLSYYLMVKGKQSVAIAQTSRSI
jgi:hypothetical protein